MYPLTKPATEGKNYTILVHEKVTFFKNPLDYSMLLKDECFSVGVLSAAAEKVAGQWHSTSHDEVGPNAQRYIDFLLDVVKMQGTACSHIILSAWGCGAFHQNAGLVAEYFKNSLKNYDQRNFPNVIFAIKEDHNSPPPGNFASFRDVFNTNP